MSLSEDQMKDLANKFAAENVLISRTVDQVVRSQVDMINTIEGLDANAQSQIMGLRLKQIIAQTAMQAFASSAGRAPTFREMVMLLTGAIEAVPENIQAMRPVHETHQ